MILHDTVFKCCSTRMLQVAAFGVGGLCIYFLLLPPTVHTYGGYGLLFVPLPLPGPSLSSPRLDAPASCLARTTVQRWYCTVSTLGYSLTQARVSNFPFCSHVSSCGHLKRYNSACEGQNPRFANPGVLKDFGQLCLPCQFGSRGLPARRNQLGSPHPHNPLT